MPLNTTPTETLPSPSLFRRLAAILYDSFLVLACLFTTGIILIILRILIEGADAIQQGEAALGGHWQLPTFITMIIVTCHFFAYFWVKNGQTLGMQAWRLSLVNNEDNKIGWKQAYIRTAAAMLSVSCVGFGYLWVLVDKDNLSWHDKLSNSHLKLLAKTSKKNK